MVGIGLAREAGEGGARVRERIHPDPEPRHPVAAGDADEAEQKNDDHLDRREAADHRPRRVGGLGQRPEVDRDDGADEKPQNKEKAALRGEIGLARLVNQLGDLPHRPMHGEIAQLGVLRETEEQAERTDHEPPQQQGPPADPTQEHGLIQIRQHERRFTSGGVLRGGSGVLEESEEREQRRRTRHAQRSPGWCRSCEGGSGSLLLRVFVILDAEMRDLLLAHQPAQRVLQLRLLDEEIVLGVEALGKLRALEIERQPLLDA